jgi:hypothetical protein
VAGEDYLRWLADRSLSTTDVSAHLSRTALRERAGVVLGPLAVAGGWRLLSLRERTPPAIEDPVLRERAGAELLEDALERHLAGRMSWYGER